MHWRNVTNFSVLAQSQAGGTVVAVGAINGTWPQAAVCAVSRQYLPTKVCKLRGYSFQWCVWSLKLGYRKLGTEGSTLDMMFRRVESPWTWKICLVHSKGNQC